MIRLQTAQRILAGANHAGAPQPLAVRAVRHPPAHLGGNDQALPVAARLHPAADNFLRPAGPRHAVRAPRGVDVRGVDEVAARLDKRVHDRERGGLVRRPAQLHGAEAQLGDVQVAATEFAKVHDTKRKPAPLTWRAWDRQFDGTTSVIARPAQPAVAVQLNGLLPPSPWGLWRTRRRPRRGLHAMTNSGKKQNSWSPPNPAANLPKCPRPTGSPSTNTASTVATALSSFAAWC